MAIKGKGKTRSRRVIAAPPRPPVYIRKPPFWRRRSTIVVVAVLAIAGILTGTLKAIHGRNTRELRKRETRAVRTFANRLTAEFPTDRQFVQPDVYFFYQSVSKDLDSFGKGKGSPALIGKEGEQMTKSADAAVTRLGRVSVDRLVPADLTVSHQAGLQAKGLTRQELTQAKSMITQSFQLYALAGTLTKLTAQAPASQRAEMVTEVQNLMGQAVNLFSSGYRVVSGLKNRLGIKTPGTSAPTGTQPGFSTPPSG